MVRFGVREIAKDIIAEIAKFYAARKPMKF